MIPTSLSCAHYCEAQDPEGGPDFGRYFAHVRIRGKLFRESHLTTDRKIAGRNLQISARTKHASILQADRTTVRDLAERHGKILAYPLPQSQGQHARSLGILTDNYQLGSPDN